MKRSKRRAFEFTGYAMIAPFYIIFITIYLFPLIQTFWNSFTDTNMFNEGQFVAMQNYVKMFEDEYFVKSIFNTLIYVVFSLFITMALGLLLALLVNNKKVNRKVTNFARASFFLPHVASMVSVSIIWIWLFDPSKGFINYLFGALGIPEQQWLADPGLALPAITFMSIWKGMGYNMMVNLSGLQAIPDMYYEAATVDGANPVQLFFKITFPLLRPTTFFLFVTGLISSFNMFEQVKVMTGGGPLNSTTTMVHQIYSNAFLKYQMGYASAQSVFLLLIIACFILLSFKLGKQGDDIGM